MLDWVGKDQPMKMRVISRGVDKKLHGNNNSVIDSGYRGEWFIPISNVNNKPVFICQKNMVEMIKDEFEDVIIYPYEKAIAQAVLLPVPKTSIEEISFEELKKIPSKRGSGALGSSGK